jgi:hypothetical protein
VEARLRQYVWLGWGVAGLGGFRVGWLVVGGETCNLRSSSTPVLSRPEVPGMRTAVSPHPVRHSAGAVRPDHRSWDMVQGGVYEASSLYTSD